MEQKIMNEKATVDSTVIGASVLVGFVKIPMLVALCLVALQIGFALPAQADILEPPASISIQSVKAFCNLVEDGDMAIFFHYRITYANDYPEIPASEPTFLFRLYSANGTLMAVSEPYVFYAFETNGYGNGASSFYFSAENITVWDEAYTINIFGVPLYYDPVQTYTYTLTSSDYSSAESQDDNRNNLYNYIMLLCDRFKTYYPTISLKAATDTGIMLSSYGESYFRGATQGLQSMCPQLFFVQVYVPEKITTDGYNTTLQEQYTIRMQGSDLMTGADRLGDLLGGISGTFFLGILFFAGCIALCIFTMRKSWGLEPGMIASAGLGILAALLFGNFFFTLVMIGGLGAAMGIMYIFGYKRA